MRQRRAVKLVRDIASPGEDWLGAKWRSTRDQAALVAAQIVKLWRFAFRRLSSVET
jgi:hypothetical protein